VASKEIRIRIYLALNHTIVEQGNALDYLILFEDDAVPSPNATWPSVGEPNTLDSMIDEREHVRGIGLVLGGSMFKDFNTNEAMTKAALNFGGIVAGGWGTGAFGLVLPRSSCALFYKAWPTRSKLDDFRARIRR
jgi:hypothetical protein